MKKLFFVVIFILATGLIMILNPNLHKQIMISENTNIVQYAETQIDWKSWHSNLLNKIMTETVAPANQPFDVLNYIDFDVDLDGNIVNIKISSEPQQYTQSAKKHFSSYIRSLEKNEILKFPSGSNRKLVHFNAVLKKAKETKLSVPDDFVDIETVRIKN